MQAGYIYKNGKYWTLRYYEDVLENGKPVRKQKTHKLAPIGEQYRNKTSVRPLADEYLAPINGRMRRPESSQRVIDFLEYTFLPHCGETLRPSTVGGYKDMFELVKRHLGKVTLNEFRTPEANQLMVDATADKRRAHTTHRNLKSFLSSAFKHAKRNGAVNENPIRDVEIPRGKAKPEREAYTADEITSMLAVLPEPSRTVVFTAALTGLRLSELKGLRWEDFTADGTVKVERAVWEGKVSETKTLTSKGAVPVVPFLAAALAEHKARNSGTGWVFHGETGNPLRMENVFRRDMQKPLAKAKIQWRGWHPFRYGVGTLLHSLGVDSKIIQGILRHANVSTTLAFYVKPVPADAHDAMKKLESAFKSASQKQREKTAEAK